MPNSVLPEMVQGSVYPERAMPTLPWLDAFAQRTVGPIARRWRSRLWSSQEFLARVSGLAITYQRLKEPDVQPTADRLRAALARQGLTDALVAESFALVREVAARLLDQRHFDVQVAGGYALLQGLVAEMHTGEGKTLTATLPACTAALAGLPVHIVTVNDYLATRDAELMGPIYRALGLSVGVIVHGLTPEARCQAYACDVTYCTNKELVFDYLKDRLAVGRQSNGIQRRLRKVASSAPGGGLLLRGLYYAIVDEADSVTVATNMAGRGTDIHLGAGVAEGGGLHVLATERHDAGRIDRQLFGRCGRQGDPGSCQALLSLEDDLVATHGTWFGRWFATQTLRWGWQVPSLWLMRLAQRAAERMHARMRRAVLKVDDRLESALAFAGRTE